MSKFLRASLGADFGYVPGEQPPDDGGWLKLNSNESPLPPSPVGGSGGCRCSRRIWRDIRARLPNHCAASWLGFMASHRSRCSSPMAPTRCWTAAFERLRLRVMRSCGRSPAIRCSPCWPRSSRSGTKWCTSSPTARCRRTSRAARPSLRVVVNPNSPTGHWTEPDTLEAQLRGAEGVVAIDEAYCDFAPASCVPLLAAHRNWLVVRTLSKSHALAGLRVGYALGDAVAHRRSQRGARFVPGGSMRHRGSDRRARGSLRITG